MLTFYPLKDVVAIDPGGSLHPFVLHRGEQTGVRVEGVPVSVEFQESGLVAVRFSDLQGARIERSFVPLQDTPDTVRALLRHEGCLPPPP